MNFCCLVGPVRALCFGLHEGGELLDREVLLAKNDCFSDFILT
jgi:hypothetical protein